MKRITLLISAIALSVLLLVVVVAPQPGYASPFDGGKADACGGVNLDPTNTTCAPGTGRLNKAVGVAVNILSVIVGVVAVVMIIIGGFKFVTSGGDAQATASARTTIIYALVGLAAVALAQGMVKFVLRKITL